MAGLWMTVALVFFPSVGSLAAVNQAELAGLIKAVNDEYNITKKMFSQALSIQSEDPSNAQQLLEDNPKDEVNKQLSAGAVYAGKRFAVATKVETLEHAEYRVLTNMNLESNAGDLLVIYSHASACPSTCTNTTSPYNIINKIDDVISKGNWSRYIFVFEKLFKPKLFKPKRSIRLKKSILIKALEDLRKSKITPPNIFRCFEPVGQKFQCTSCFNGEEVKDACVNYYA